MLKTYDVTCPNCQEEFEVDIDPATEEEYIQCPVCEDEVDWEYDAATDALTLSLLPDDDEDDEMDGDDEEEDELG